MAPTAWATPLASAFAPDCAQTAEIGDQSTHEDCLYLNVWTPARHPDSPAPVMVFVHGGSFVWGSASNTGGSNLDGTNLAETTGNLVVTISYRLGAFGFLSNAELRSEDTAHGSAGNYGILDQIAAFQWVHDNIAAFGGDPANVTIFGESAGATSMFVHLASPLSKGLFSRVIIESAWAGYQSAQATAVPQSTADATGATLATALACTDATMLLSCLRGKSTDSVLNAVPAANNLTPTAAPVWAPVIDGYVLLTEPIKAITVGSFTKVPILLGDNKNEGTESFFGAAPHDDASYVAAVDGLAPGHGAAIVAEYPIASYAGSYFNAASAAMTDARFLCPARRVARAIATSATPTFRYDFTYVPTACVGGVLGAYHTAELLFVFGNSDNCGNGGFTLQPSAVPLSQTIMGYWGAMAKSGDPNGGGRVPWPKYDTSTEPEIVLDLVQATETQLEKAQCDFWDGLGP